MTKKHYLMEPHIHVNLDAHGYCEDCGVRVITHFKGWPLPDRPPLGNHCTCPNGPMPGHYIGCPLAEDLGLPRP